jgi:spore germination cell wall hydrolase CwlJ-like protein
MRKNFLRFGVLILATHLLTGCVANQSPKSNLTTDLEASTNDQASFASDLPDNGPNPESRPNILALASGASSDADEANENTKPKPAVLQAMVEPDKKSDVLKQISVSTEKAQPVLASNRERDCLMRAMYFESNRSSPDGLLSVGTVVMHRLKNGAWGNSICSVVGSPRQFAPGVLSRRMQGNLSDLQRLADTIIAGKRQPKLGRNVLFFHTAGLRFPYKNMRYVHVAGGNTFYYKAQRKRRA